MAEEMISKERIDYTIDLLITMAVEEIAEDTEVTTFFRGVLSIA